MDGWRWDYFKPEEVLSPDGLRLLGEGTMLISPVLLDTLTGFRDHVGHPLLVNHGLLKLRGYRSPGENYKVGGKPFSFHMQGLAVDVSCEALEMPAFLELAESFPDWTGIGYYPKLRFIHLDIRPQLGYPERTSWIG